MSKKILSVSILLSVFSLSAVATADNVSISDHIWNDKNANGIQEDNEQGINGAAVQLLTCKGTQVASTVTALNGNYQFSGIKPGSYKIRFVLKSGKEFTYNGPQMKGGINNKVIVSPWGAC
ncbi:carboxypeptidase regulatory-like domain-containing protein [Endozoicomonas sp. SM1973]|uniref:Carboxypeptidase regulatory-like domain-containing protein n=1 Tax=Spartinivicinus marinus TaxID=2994442 RepID=A0A853I8J7_9GAMM|nr:SdrD B-like domain-containing protein [Spartinivicinus marinus]MCX4027424.1 carboxypeptidase regulatory-like domain-containing protein [Spartinivicinus marinus]NYZ66404.1 carboxypeptidase regulatory-like domain-containing protein [Spartinivicinus marinus]